MISMKSKDFTPLIMAFLFLALTVLAFWPCVAEANAGLPMLGIVWPLSWLAFIPVVGIEGAAARSVVGLSWSRSFLASGAANLASTLIGIPITWILLVLVEMIVGLAGEVLGFAGLTGKVYAVTIQAPWFAAYEPDLHWMMPAALLVLLPFFGFTSIFIERSVFRKVSRCERADANLWSWKANCITYGFAIAVAVAWLVLALTIGGGQ